MNIITENHWELFLKAGKFNGRLFEKFIERILDLGFAGNWKPTGGSWDDAHDFVNLTFKETGGKWAECKMYRKNLSTHIIAKTLVMAVNHHINTILIFSYSPLVPNALIHIAEFSTITNKRIQIFDDIKLERLILKLMSYNELQNYFPDLEKKDIAKIVPCQVDSFFCNDISIGCSQLPDDHHEKEDNHYEIKKGCLCLYELIFSSNLIEESNIELDFSNFFDSLGNQRHEINIINLPQLLLENKGIPYHESSQYTNIQDPVFRKKLEAGEVFSLRLYYMPVDSGKNTIPGIDIRFADYEGLTYKETNINVSDLVKPPFIGVRMLRLLDDIGEKISCSGRFLFRMISGESGVGKSRFMEEIVQRLLKHNYNVYLIDGNQSNVAEFNTFLIELLSQLYRLPNPERLKCDNSFLDFYSTGEQIEEIEHGVHSLIKLAYEKYEFSFDDIQKRILPLIKCQLLERKSALLFDNVQFFSDLSIILLHELQSLINTYGKNVLAYVFNTETLDYASRAGSLFHQLSERFPHEHIEIGAFDRRTAQLFLDSIIRLKSKYEFSDVYPDLVEQILQSIELKPFYLMQFIEHTKDEKIISFSNGQFFIESIEKFYEQLNEISDDSRKILKLRLRNLNEDQKKAICLMKHLGEIDARFVRGNNLIETHIIDYLVNRNFFKEENGRLMFIHSLMEEFLLAEDSFEDEILNKKIYDCLFGFSFMREHYPLSLFSLYPNQNVFDSAIAQVETLSSLSSRNKFYARRVLEYIYSKGRELSPETYLLTIIKIALFSSGNNQREFCNLLKNLWEYLKFYKPMTENSIYCLIEIARECGSYLTVFNEFQTGISILKEGIKQLMLLPIDESIKKSLYARLQNRIGVAYKQRRKLQQARNFIFDALEKVQHLHDYSMVCLSYIDLGYIFYGQLETISKTRRFWSKAVSIYQCYEEKIWQDDRNTFLACLLTKCLLHGIDKEYSEAISLAQEIIETAQKECSIYYELQGRRAKVFFEFLDGSRSVDIEQQLHELISFSSKCKIYKYHLFSYHLLAVFYEEKEKVELAEKQYAYILDKLCNSSDLNVFSLEAYLVYMDSISFYSRRDILHRFPINEVKNERLKRKYQKGYPSKDECFYHVGRYYMSLA